MKTHFLGLAMALSLLCACDSCFDEPESPLTQQETDTIETRNSEEKDGVSSIVIIIDDVTEYDIEFSL